MARKAAGNQHTASIFGPRGMLNEIPTQSRQSSEAWSTQGTGPPVSRQRYLAPDRSMRITPLALLLLLFAAPPARAELHITRDHGGYVEEYKARDARIRDRKERVIIHGSWLSASTLGLCHSP